MKITPIITILITLALADYSPAQTIRIAKLENTPDHILGGMLLEAIYKEAKVPLELVIIPSARALIQSSKGKVDGELQRIYALADSYPTLLRVPTAFTFFEPSVFTKSKLINIDGWASLQGYKVGMVRGMKFAEIGLKGNTNVHTVTGSNQLFTMLKLGRLDIAISARFNGLYQRSKLKLNSIRLLEPALEHHDLYHYLHIKHQQLVPIIDAAIQSMVKSGKLQRLRKQFYKDILK